MFVNDRHWKGTKVKLIEGWLNVCNVLKFPSKEVNLLFRGELVALYNNCIKYVFMIVNLSVLVSDQ